MDSTTAQFLNFLQGNALKIEAALLFLLLVCVSMYYSEIPGSSISLVRFVNLVEPLRKS